jgi:hypothetical protein
MASHGMKWEVQEDNTLFSDKSKLLLFHLGPYTTTACLHSTTSSTCFKVVNRLVNILKFYIVPSWRLAVFPMGLGWTFEKTMESRQSRALYDACRLSLWSLQQDHVGYHLHQRLVLQHRAAPFGTVKELAKYTTSLLVSIIFNHVQSIW